MGKVFQEQTKTIKDQGEEQGKAIKSNNTKAHCYENELLLLKEREMFKNTYNKRLDRIEESTKKIDYGDFKFFAESNDNKTDFTEIENPVDFLNNIKINKITIEQAKV